LKGRKGTDKQIKVVENKRIRFGELKYIGDNRRKQVKGGK
jgi:hypothetical protein